ncbi:hypothetical protein [Hymenobacter persicinus]|uniref:Outer membrane protein beta-barrel domain-containing protein n=1 Tax=Hymenobacter persicinus TaxID=2025506 RepID=A0A4Q5LFT9_9BACT|nr:hypothetical protein [Hymenobacter persicinus]RYU84274.1 hypothetical protein EWM57_00860 [Hymenobacter persicinus]
MNHKLWLTGLLACGGLTSLSARAQSTTPAEAAPKWQFYFEAGPKLTSIKINEGGASAAYPKPSYDYERDVKPQMRNTVSSFADVKGFHALSRRLVLSSTVGLDMQHLNFKTGIREEFAGGGFTSYTRTHVSRLLTRARVDFGLHYQFNLGEKGHLLPGVALGQMINLSKNGYGYTFVQPGLYFTNDRLLFSLTAATTAYNVLIPEASTFASTYNAQQVTGNFEFRVREVQLGIGARF